MKANVRSGMMATVDGLSEEPAEARAELLVVELDPNWDGTKVNVVDITAESAELLAVVQFEGCVGHKFGLLQ